MRFWTLPVVARLVQVPSRSSPWVGVSATSATDSIEESASVKLVPLVT
jgi:hypothetical protein